MDECLAATPPCDKNALCVNSVGGFSCSCKAGFAGSGLTCTDRDECAEGLATCGRDAVCSNTPGSYRCTCKAGFAGDGQTCQDVDECAAHTDGCDPHASCINTVGSHRCACHTGYAGDGRSCTSLPAPAKAIAAGGAHTCALLASGSVRCWGWGWGIYGELGYGNTRDVGDDEAPASSGDVPLGGSAAQLALGPTHTCAVLTDGKVRCWGRNRYGALGYGHSRSVGDDETPASQGDVPLPGQVSQLAAGGEHTCALLDSGKVRCWGLNVDGQLGYAHTSPVNALYAAEVSVGEAAAELVAGRDHTCARLATGAVRCWGRSAWGQLGYGNPRSVGDDELPSSAGDVPLGARAVGLAAGWYHTCAILDSGRVRCWGFGGFGQLGIGSTANVGDDELPTAVAAVDLGEPAVQLVAGAFHTCALLKSGAVRCWGQATRGQVGVVTCGNLGDDELPTTEAPVFVGGVVERLAAGSFHTCALIAGGTVRCWGVGEFGRLGYANTQTIGDDELPGSAGDVPVTPDVNECKGTPSLCSAGALCINTLGSYVCQCKPGFAGDGKSCTDLDECASGTHRCDAHATCTNTGGGYACQCNSGWVGDGTQCALKDNCAAGHTCSPNALCSSTASGYTCACKPGFVGDGRTCVDLDECALGTSDCDPLAACTNTAGGYACVCRPGTVGDGRRCTPDAVRSVVAGGTHTCALLAGGVKCWGMGYVGQLGYGNPLGIGNTNTPASVGLVPVGGEVVELALGGSHTCARLATGAVRCWGSGASGQLGYGNTRNVGDDETPASAGDVNLGGTALQVVAGGNHTCALLAGGQVKCWGNGQRGQLGYGDTRNLGDDELPSAVGFVAVGAKVTRLSAGNEHTCALLESGAVRCWGNGSFGRLGYGNTTSIGDDEAPAVAGDVVLGGKAVQLAAGHAHTCALLDSGEVRCWGQGQTGRLGYGNSANLGDDELPAVAGAVPLGGRARRISASFHTCALLEGGGVRCWGQSIDGRLGYGNTLAIGDDEFPSSVGLVSLGDKALEVSAGVMHTCALLERGEVRCWGSGAYGQLGYGNGENIGDDEEPVVAGGVPLH